MPAIASEKARTTPAHTLPQKTRVAFVTNFAPHYRVRMFEALAKLCDLTCYFYSDGGEWYWQRAHGVNQGEFRGCYLSGFWLGRTRIALGLIPGLLFGSYEVFVKCINDRFALPVTYLAARLRGRPFVLWTGVWCRLTTPVQRFLFPLTRYLYRNSDAVVAYGAHVRRYLISEGVPAERIFLAPQAVDSGHYGRAVPAREIEQLREKFKIPPQKKVLVYLGRLEPSKGLEYLLDAFALCPDRESILVLCGAGSVASELRERAEELGIGRRIIFTGYVETSSAVHFYSLAWAVLLPSVTTPGGKEPWGLVVNEAFHQGVPVIATDAVGAAAGGLVRHLETGLVVAERDAVLLSQAIGRILTDTALRERLGANARREVAPWTHQGMAEGFRDAIQFALERAGK